jgi:hypothetical protein
MNLFTAFGKKLGERKSIFLHLPIAVSLVTQRKYVCMMVSTDESFSYLGAHGGIHLHPQNDIS